MRELTVNEIGFVFGGQSNTPTCPAGTTLTSSTYNSQGNLESYTCTSNQEVQKSDWTLVGAVLGAIAAVGTFIVVLIAGS